MSELDTILQQMRKSPFGGMLAEIGGWHIGCENEAENAAAVRMAVERGFVTQRTHYALAFPEGVPAYELTNAGLEEVRRLCGDETTKNAEKTRAWYRENAIKQKPSI